MTKRNNFRLAAVLLLFSLITASCITTDKTLGDDFVPNDHILGVSTAEIEVPLQMKMADSLQTIFPGYLVIGAYKDQDLGTTLSCAAFQIIPTIHGNDYGENPVPSYIKLSMAVNQRLALESVDNSIPQNIYVYTLKKDLDSTTAYNNSISADDIDPTPLNKGGVVYFGGDSIVMNLPLDFAKKLLTASKEERDSAVVFTKKFKGLYLTTEPLPGAIKGGRFNIIDPASLYMELKYRHVDTKNKIDKDSLLYYYISTAKPYLNTFSHSSKRLETDKSQETVYIEGLAGIKPYIDFSEVRKNMSAWAKAKNTDISKIIISRAELRFPYEFPSDYLTMKQFPSQIFLATKEEQAAYDLPFYQPSSDIYVLSSGLNNRSFNYYSMDISAYLQKVLKGSISGKALNAWITPVGSTTNSYSGTTTYYVDNLIYCKAKLNGNSSARKPYMVVTYAIAN